MEGLRKFIFGALESLAGVGFMLVIVFSAIQGALNAGFWGFLFGVVIGFVAAVVIFGIVFLLLDINENIRRIAERDEPPAKY